MHQFAEGVVVEVTGIIICSRTQSPKTNYVDIFYNDDPEETRQRLSYYEIENLAYEDGFDSVVDFWRYFASPKGQLFIGQLIRWDLDETFVPKGEPV
jgi:hypothetical protein